MKALSRLAVTIALTCALSLTASAQTPTTHFDWARDGTCREFTSFGGQIDAPTVDFDVCRKISPTHIAWARFGRDGIYECAELTKLGDLVNWVGRAECRHLASSTFDWDANGVCQEYPASGGVAAGNSVSTICRNQSPTHTAWTLFSGTREYRCAETSHQGYFIAWVDLDKCRFRTSTDTDLGTKLEQGLRAPHALENAVAELDDPKSVAGSAASLTPSREGPAQSLSTAAE